MLEVRAAAHKMPTSIRIRLAVLLGFPFQRFSTTRRARALCTSAVCPRDALRRVMRLARHEHALMEILSSCGDEVISQI